MFVRACRNISSSASARSSLYGAAPPSTMASSSWDQIFKNLPDSPPPYPNASPFGVGSPRLPSTQVPTQRRQTMTAQEISAFDDMFNMIFQAVSNHTKMGGDPATLGTSTTPGIGIHGADAGLRMHALAGRVLRRGGSVNAPKWTTDTETELDQKKEQMELCDTDAELVQWALREVFGDGSHPLMSPSQPPLTTTAEAASKTATETSTKTAPEPTTPVQTSLQNPAYPHLLAHLMRTFREKYQDPHLALALFSHARHSSVPSYVFGCTTPAYNELLLTRWVCFRDLRGVWEAMVEMKANGVEPDAGTRRVVEKVRREVGEGAGWLLEGNFGLGARGKEDEDADGEVVRLLDRIVELSARGRSAMMSASRNPAAPAPYRRLSGEDEDDFGIGGPRGTQLTQYNYQRKASQTRRILGLGLRGAGREDGGKAKGTAMAMFEPWKAEARGESGDDGYRFGDWGGDGVDDHEEGAYEARYGARSDFERDERETPREKHPSRTFMRAPKPPKSSTQNANKQPRGPAARSFPGISSAYANPDAPSSDSYQASPSPSYADEAEAEEYANDPESGDEATFAELTDYQFRLQRESVHGVDEMSMDDADMDALVPEFEDFTPEDRRAEDYSQSGDGDAATPVSR